AIQSDIDSGAIQSLESVPLLIVQDGSRWSLSKAFVSAQTAKLLILAGSDRLDKELLIAQMQGKFQLELLPPAGHAIREDLPDMVGDVVTLFWKCN
ncbi:Protein phosphatase methylesterase 1, partial [Kickxella alabastrina]